MKKFYWRKIQISKIASKEDNEEAKNSAKGYTIGKLQNLEYIEANPEWVLLNEHAMMGQISSNIMRYMKRRDLYFLAGMSFPHHELVQPRSEREENLDFMPGGSAETRWKKATKLQGNAMRASIEIKRRNFIWSGFLVLLAALVGGLLGGGLIEWLG